MVSLKQIKRGKKKEQRETNDRVSLNIAKY